MSDLRLGGLQILIVSTRHILVSIDLPKHIKWRRLTLMSEASAGLLDRRLATVVRQLSADAPDPITEIQAIQVNREKGLQQLGLLINFIVFLQ